MATIIHHNYEEPNMFDGKRDYPLSIRYIFNLIEHKKTLNNMTERLHDELKKYDMTGVYVINRNYRAKNISGVQIRLSNKFTIAAFYLSDLKIHTVMYKLNKLVTTDTFGYKVENSPEFLSVGMLVVHLEYIKDALSRNFLNETNIQEVNIASLIK
jgi:hypothetical protein